MVQDDKRLEGLFSSKDERIFLEMGRIYKLGYIGMVVSAIVAMFYDTMVESVVAEHRLLADGADQHAIPTIVVLAFGMCVTACNMAAMQTSKGIAEDSKFAESDRYPLAHYVIYSAAVALAVGAAVIALRAFAEGQLLGIGSVDLAAGLPFAFVCIAAVFVGCLLASYLSFLRAKKARMRILQS